MFNMNDLANDCEEDRYFRACLPVLSSIGVTDLSSIPCLSALLKNLHLSIKAQYAYEEVCTHSCIIIYRISNLKDQVAKMNTQLVHSKFLQHLISLAFGLGIVPVILRDHTHLFLKPVATLDPSWQWLKTCSDCLNVSSCCIIRMLLVIVCKYCRLLVHLLKDQRYQITFNTLSLKKVKLH